MQWSCSIVPELQSGWDMLELFALCVALPADGSAKDAWSCLMDMSPQPQDKSAEPPDFFMKHKYAETVAEIPENIAPRCGAAACT